MALDGVDADGARFVVDDPEHRWQAVRLWYHLRHPYPDRAFDRHDGQWTYHLPRPHVDRLEYLLEVTDAEGTRLMVDESNPRRVGGAFGEHSVLEFPGYVPAPWLDVPAPQGVRRPLSLPHAHGLRRDLPAQVWTPLGRDERSERLPMLVMHDGPEMDAFAGITRYAAAMVHAAVLPPFRVVLLAPGDRDAWYSASPAYARSLATTGLPALLHEVPTQGRPVLAGASLGALAALHAEWMHPGTVAGLFLASGSFFQLRLDEQESGFGRFFRIAAATQHILDARVPSSRAPVAMVCGTGEENWENNQAMLAALRRAGVPVAFTEFRDGHTWTGWRDSLHPALTSLLLSLWGVANDD